MGAFIRKSSAPSDKYGAIVYYVESSGFVRESNGPGDKYGTIVYYFDDDGFVRKSNGPSDKYGAIVYYVDDDGFVRKSNGPSDKYGAIMYYVDDDGFVRKSNGPSDKYGAIVYYTSKEAAKQETKQEIKQKTTTQNVDSKGFLLLIALVIGLIFAPILIVLGMFGKFLLGGLFKNVLPIEAFKKFRKGYSILNFVWLGLGIAAIVVLAILEIDVTIPLYALVGGNVVLFVLSIVFGNKIYNEHKHELPQPVEEPVAEETEAMEMADEASVESGELMAGEAEEPSNEDVVPPTDTMQKNLLAIKQLKELLDMGAITQAEFNEKKKLLLGSISAPQQATKKEKKPSSPKVLYTINLIFSIMAAVTFIVGFVFLCFVSIETYYDYRQVTFNYFDIAFGQGMEPNVLYLFTVIGFILSGICLAFEVIGDIKKKKNDTKAIIVDVLAILSLTIAIVFGFVSYGTVGWDYYDSDLVAFILVSSACVVVLLHWILAIIIKCINSEQQTN